VSTTTPSPPPGPEPPRGEDENAEERAEADIVHEWGLESFPASDPPANY
jgi:hypothetical protein